MQDNVSQAIEVWNWLNDKVGFWREIPDFENYLMHSKSRQIKRKLKTPGTYGKPLKQHTDRSFTFVDLIKEKKNHRFGIDRLYRMTFEGNHGLYLQKRTEQNRKTQKPRKLIW